MAIFMSVLVNYNIKNENIRESRMNDPVFKHCIA